MVKTKIVKAAGRFGCRYGQHVRRKIAVVESKQRKKQACPFCNGTIKRSSKGIWLCKKCKTKFAGHAYFIEKGSMDIRKEVKAKSLNNKKNIINKEDKKKRSAPKIKNTEKSSKTSSKKSSINKKTKLKKN